MLDKRASSIIETDTGLLTQAQAQAIAVPGSAMHTLLGWLATYPVSPHPDLGRAGVVCPFTRPARKLDTIRLAVSACSETDVRSAAREIRRGLNSLKYIPAQPDDEHFRTVAIGFPNCTSEMGIAT